MMRLEMPTRFDGCAVSPRYVTPPIPIEEDREQLANAMPPRAAQGVEFLLDQYRTKFVEPVLCLDSREALVEFMQKNGENIIEMTALLHAYVAKAMSDEGAFHRARAQSEAAMKRLAFGARALGGEEAAEAVEFAVNTHRNALNLVRALLKLDHVELSDEAKSETTEHRGLFNIGVAFYVFCGAALLRASAAENLQASSDVIGGLFVWLEESALLSFRHARAALDLRLQAADALAPELTLQRDHDAEDAALLDADLL